MAARARGCGRLYVTALDDAVNDGQHLPPHQRFPTHVFGGVTDRGWLRRLAHNRAIAANQRSHIHTRRRVSITTINELQATDREIVGHRWLQKASSGLLQE
jgi:hypothetical protein